MDEWMEYQEMWWEFNVLRVQGMKSKGIENNARSLQGLMYNTNWESTHANLHHHQNLYTFLWFFRGGWPGVDFRVRV